MIICQKKSLSLLLLFVVDDDDSNEYMNIYYSGFIEDSSQISAKNVHPEDYLKGDVY